MKKTVSFQDHEVLRLTDGDSSLLVAPDYGARLLNWDIGSTPVIFWPENADWDKIPDVRGGNPILFPFIARHMVDGKIGFWKDETGTVRELPMHGFARNLPFAIIPADENTVHLRLNSSPSTRGMYPFDWQFDVVYRLTESTLEVRLETTNTGGQPMPYYTGHHFYFAVPHEERAQWTLDLPCRQWAGQDFSTGDIHFRNAESAQTQLNDPALVDRMHVHPGAVITLRNEVSDRSLAIELGESTREWYDVTTWTENDKSDFYCIEPWLGLPNAIHHGHGLRHLPPGAHESAVCSVDATNWLATK